MSETRFTTDELMVVAAAREIRDNMVCFVGTGLPMVAAYLAKATHAPDMVMIFESGIIDSRPRKIAVGVGDFALLRGSTMLANLQYVFGLLQRGAIDLGFLGAAQVDEYGNINSTVIGDYFKPKVRLPGSGGANDIASLARETVIIVRHELRKFPKRVDYLTTPGFLTGPGSREAAGLPGKGPKRVITTLGVLGFDNATKKMVVQSLHPGVTLEQMQAQTGFELEVASNLKVTDPPTTEELRLIREIDPEDVYVNKV